MRSGDRRDEDLVAIADAVAGRFDHYICRRDDALRGRDGDEVPGILSRALRAAGVAEEAISIIPDEQMAVDAALRMGAPGDLLLIFADALVRSWKQIIKFQPEGSSETRAESSAGTTTPPVIEPEFDESSFADLGDVVRDERGIRLSREIND
jgi:cyanophycin synthetase